MEFAALRVPDPGNQKSIMNEAKALAVAGLFGKILGGIQVQLCWREVTNMCRNIRTLYNFDPPVTDEEVKAAALQFVRKITGFNKPSKSNEAAFLAAVEKVAGVSTELLLSLETNAPPKNREEEKVKAQARAAERFGA
jgi:hypothetical protein